MDESNDIKNLFAEIGVSDGAYRDITREEAQHESLARWPLLSSIHYGRAGTGPGRVLAESPAALRGPQPRGESVPQGPADRRAEPLAATVPVCGTVAVAPAGAVSKGEKERAEAAKPVAQFIPPRPRHETRTQMMAPPGQGPVSPVPMALPQSRHLPTPKNAPALASADVRLRDASASDRRAAASDQHRRAPTQLAAAARLPVQAVAIVSPSGGVGKTTLTVNLAVALRRAGHSVLVLDLDPQSASRFHFDLDLSRTDGWSRCAIEGRSLREACAMSAAGVEVLPFGDLAEEERACLEAEMQKDGDWLQARLSAMRLAAGTVVLIDVPPGASAYLRQALEVARVVLVVTSPDAASYAARPGMEKLLQTYCSRRPEFRGSAYVINQMDGSRQLSRDVGELLRSELGGRLVGVVHQDVEVGEAAACRRSVIEYAPHSQASRDLLACAKWLERRLPLGVVDRD